MVNETEKLRSVIADETQPLTARKAAAEHLVRLKIETVEAAGVPDDDVEVVSLMQPWKDTKLAQMFSHTSGAPPQAGWPLPIAKAKVLQNRKLRVVLAVAVDKAAHRLERLAACKRILEDHPQIVLWRYNSATPEKLLATALPDDAVKWTSQSLFHGPVPVSRPPTELADVWRL
jgi:hypothetical protein